MRPAVLAPLLLLLASSPGLSADGEVVRLEQKLERLAQKNQWSGVERTYQELLATGVGPTVDHLRLAAEAARNRGDVLAAIVRLLTARSKVDGVDAELDAAFADLTGRFGHVQLEGQQALVVGSPPFQPDARAAITFAQQELAARHYFDGFVPIGAYTFGGQPFEVRADQTEPVIVSTRTPDDAVDLTVRGVSFARKTLARGQLLRLNGVGVNHRRGVAVYVAALYVQRPTSDAEALIRSTDPKRLVLEFVFEQAPREAFVRVFRELFAKGPGASDLEAEIEAFLGAFDADFSAGDKVTFDYVHGRGTLIEVNGTRKATIAGEPFMRAAFRVFLGQDPPSDALRDGLLGVR